MDKHIINNLKASENVIIFGAGTAGREIYTIINEYYKLQCNIYFCDNNKKGFEPYTEIKIIKPDDIKNIPNSTVLISIDSYEYINQVKEQLLNLGINKQNIYDYHEFVTEIHNDTNGGLEWKNLEKTYDWSVRRGQIKKMSEWIDENDKSVIDFGAGECYLKSCLNPDVKYIPTDYIARTPAHIVFDFNEDEFPDIKADVCVINHALCYVKNYKTFLKNVCSTALHKIIVFSTIRDKNAVKESVFSINYFTSDNDIIEVVEENGFKLEKHIINPDSTIDCHEVGLLFKK